MICYALDVICYAFTFRCLTAKRCGRGARDEVGVNWGGSPNFLGRRRRGAPRRSLRRPRKTPRHHGDRDAGKCLLWAFHLLSAHLFIGSSVSSALARICQNHLKTWTGHNPEQISLGFISDRSVVPIRSIEAYHRLRAYWCIYEVVSLRTNPVRFPGLFSVMQTNTVDQHCCCLSSCQGRRQKS